MSTLKKYKGEEYFDQKYQDIIEAIDNGKLEDLNLLLADKDLNVQGKDNLTFIYYSFLNDNKEIFTYLLRRKANPDIAFIKVNEDSTHIINEATELGDDFYFDQLVKVANLEVKDERGAYPIHNAINVERPDRVNSLLEHGANINSRDKKGQTPVYLLCALNNFKSALELINKGADLTIKNVTGSSVGLLIQESKFPVTTEAYKYQQQIRAELVKQGVRFPVKRPWEHI